jgi:hypothetical protein
MPVATPLPDLTLGTRFPSRLLNLFPAAWKRRHLIHASGGDQEPQSFAVTEALRNAKRILFAWPYEAVEILEAFPAARALVDALPADTECIHLCEAANASLAQGLFPNAVLTWRHETLAWYDSEMQTLVSDLKAFAPEITITFSQSPYPHVLQAALRASRAGARIAWESAMSAPFSNISLEPEIATPRAARFFQSLDLWRYAGFAPRTQWTYLQPDTGRHEMALREWEAKRATPETTWLFVQDAANINALDEALFQTISEKIRAREPGRFTLGAVLWNPELKPISRQGQWLDAPVFHESDFSALLAALDGARGVIGYHCFALQFASLVEVRVSGLLDPSESRHDISGLNPRFEVEWQ